MTVLELIQGAVSDGLGLPRDPIQNEILLEAISRYNKVGRVIFDEELWANKKIDQFLSSDSTYVSSYDTSTGIITFTSSVDMVLAVVVVNSSSLDNDSFVWAENEISAMLRGDQTGITSGRYHKLADTAAGLTRIKVNPNDDVQSYRILATKNFVEATVESSYSSSDPTATPTDYRVLEWTIPDALPVIQAYMADELRSWDGQARRGDWAQLLGNAKSKTITQEGRENVIMPIGDFGEVGAWQNTGTTTKKTF